MSTLLSTYLTLEELLHTSRPIANEIQAVRRYGRLHSVEQIRADLERTVRTLMDPLIERFGHGVVASGYRCPAVNSAVGGAMNSAHPVGLAVDWHPPGTIREAMQWAVGAGLPYDRLIVEERGASRWLHVQAAEADAQPARLLYLSPSRNIYTALEAADLAALQV